jgi:ssDNA thymidine ADP-ribosyltransferase, DarT
VLRSQVGELFYICRISNVPSILRYGILAHNKVSRIAHDRIDSPEVQGIRDRVQVGDRMLHDFANLYICGRNAMMLAVKSAHGRDAICLLRVSPAVLDVEGVVVTDGNAARKYETSFFDVPDGLAAIDFDRVHAEWWSRHGSALENYEHKREKQAEVLVPDFVHPAWIVGAYAATGVASAAVTAAFGGKLPVIVTRYPFFEGPQGT